MKQITLTEKRFFEWHEDELSVTLRNKGGSYGGGSEVFVIMIDEEEDVENIHQLIRGALPLRLMRVTSKDRD